jgi:hypothetical protein
MNFFVAVTDYDWFLLHAAKPHIEEGNFWRPSSAAPFKAPARCATPPGTRSLPSSRQVLEVLATSGYCIERSTRYDLS